MEKPIRFQGEDFELYGIIHIPERESHPRLGIIMLNSGLGNRVGVHRLYANVARSLSSEGYWVLRFDYHGVGDSQGDLPPGFYVEHFASVEKGLFVKDSIGAIDFFVHESKMENVVLWGGCGGAITGLLTAATDKRVKGLVLVEAPVMMDSLARDYASEITPANAKEYLSVYIKKIFSLKAWIRFLTFKSEYRTMGKAARVLVKSKLLQKRDDFEEESAEKNLWFNKEFVKSFKSFVSRGKILFLFAEKSDLYGQFEAEFKHKYLPSKNRYDPFYSIEIIPEADHNFLLFEPQKVLIQKTKNWLKDF